MFLLLPKFGGKHGFDFIQNEIDEVRGHFFKFEKEEKQFKFK